MASNCAGQTESPEKLGCGEAQALDVTLLQTEALIPKPSVY
jgi:hypothetical protein